MTSQTGGDRSHESVINDTLARIFRDRLGFPAVAETLLDGKRPDIIVRLPQAAPVILEIELEPARTVDADALSRLGMELDGEEVQNVFARNRARSTPHCGSAAPLRPLGGRNP